MIEWLQDKMKPVTEMLTRSHHKVVRQFMAYKARTEESVRKLEEYTQRMLDAENALALRIPIYEAEYALHKSSALSLFDCYLPELEEHREIKEMTMAQ